MGTGPRLCAFVKKGFLEASLCVVPLPSGKHMSYRSSQTLGLAGSGMWWSLSGVREGGCCLARARTPPHCQRWKGLQRAASPALWTEGETGPAGKCAAEARWVISSSTRLVPYSSQSIFPDSLSLKPGNHPVQYMEYLFVTEAQRNDVSPLEETSQG